VDRRAGTPAAADRHAPPAAPGAAHSAAEQEQRRRGREQRRVQRCPRPAEDPSGDGHAQPELATDLGLDGPHRILETVVVALEQETPTRKTDDAVQDVDPERGIVVEDNVADVVRVRVADDRQVATV